MEERRTLLELEGRFHPPSFRFFLAKAQKMACLSGENTYSSITTARFDTPTIELSISFFEHRLNSKILNSYFMGQF